MSDNKFEFNADDLKEELEELEREESKILKEKFKRHYDGFWEFQKYMDSSPRSGYSDEQIDVKLISYAMYLVIWGYISNFVLSMPRRRRKSHAVNDAVKYVVGFMPDRSNARFSHSENLVKKHSRMIKKEIQSDRFLIPFPNIKLKADAKSVLEWETDKCSGEPTFHCAGVGGTATGYGVDKLLIADDLISGWKSAHSEADKSTIDSFVSGNFESSEEDGMCVLHIATRWSETDPPGKFMNDALIAGNRIFKFDAYSTKLTDENITEFIDNILGSNPTENDVMHITIPALDKDDETTAPYHNKYTTEYYKAMRKKRFSRNEHHIWFSIYQQDPRQKGSLLFIDFNNWYLIKDLKNIRFSGGVSYLDPSGKGRNNTCLGLARTIGEDVYINPEIVYTPEKPTDSKVEVINFLKKYHKYISILTGEGNGGGDQYCESVNEKLDENEEIKIEIEIVNTDQNKELKIFLNSDWILTHVHLPAEYDDAGKRQYEIDSPIDRCIKALTKYVGKVDGQFVRNQEDDFLDFLCGVKDMVAEDGNEFDVDYY